MIDTTVKPTLRFYFAQLWEYRELLLNFVNRDIKAQTKQSFFGYLWVFVPTLFQMGLFSLLFQGILKVRMTENIPYPVFLYCTLLPWQMFAAMVNEGTKSIVGHIGLIRQVYFPKEIVVLSVMSAVAFRTLIASTVLIALMILFNIGVSFNILWLPVLVLIQFVFTFGLILPLSGLNAFARDVGKSIDIGLSVWMYITPVVYPLEKVPEAYQGLYLLNPMAVIIQSYRQVVLEGASPDITRLMMVGLFAAALFFGGYMLFKKTEPAVADLA